MRNRILPTAFIGAFIIFLSTYSCTKIDTTTLGADLIPVVDNVNTFADTFDIVSTQGIFDNDTTKVFNYQQHAVGNINGDPLFGNTSATVYLQLKPFFFPYYFGNTGDTLTGPGAGIDSVVFCLSYVNAWGDSSIPQEFEVRQIIDGGFRDSLTLLRSVKYTPQSLGNVLGTSVIDIPSLKNQIKINNGKDSVTNQIRIKINDPAFIADLYNRDSTDNTFNNAFKTDSIFRSFYNGFAVIPVSTASRSLLYVNLSNANTALEVYYRKRNNGVIDTTLAVFPFYSGANTYPSSSGNNIVRNYTTPFPAGNTDIYLQTQPGTYADLRIPALNAYSNRIVHRAEILMDQQPDNVMTDSAFSPPSYLYLDLVDTPAGVNIWKPLYYDLNPANAYDPDNKSGLPYFPASYPDPSYFGGTPKFVTTGGSTKLEYSFNVTRYVQRKVTQQAPNYPIRLFSPFNIVYPQYASSLYPYFNTIARGRVRLAGGANADRSRRMRMVVIWSNIK